jgi:hypothetical protein
MTSPLFEKDRALPDRALPKGAVAIERFEVDPPSLRDIDQPTHVYASWKVQNASAVTLSCVGVVPGEQERLELSVEETTTFVLTAYDSAFHTIVAERRTVEVAPSLASRMVPAGTILAWWGSLEDIPANWLLCDGQNGTPDLRERFIVGAGLSRQPHEVGEADTHTHTIKRLQGSFPTTREGWHTHGMPGKYYGRGFGGGKYTGIDTRGNFTINEQTQGAGIHSHTVDIAFESFTSKENVGGVKPPWYALCYIMKARWQQ